MSNSGEHEYLWRQVRANEQHLEDVRETANENALILARHTLRIEALEADMAARRDLKKTWRNAMIAGAVGILLTALSLADAIKDWLRALRHQ